MLQTKDRVWETTTVTGTGAVTLLGAKTGYQAFQAAMSVSDTCYYSISDTLNGAWEVGIGTLTATTILARTTVLSSSNAGALVTFAAGTKDVFLTMPAAEIGTDATTSSKGIVQLAGDLAGTAVLPTVPGLALKAPLASPTFTGTVVLPSGQALIAPALGTPASGVATNLSGTAAGLTAGTVTNATLTTALTVNTGTLTLTANSANTSVLTIGAGAVSVSGTNTGDQTNISGNAATVTTNASLTGPIASSGNVTSITSQTGTGTKFVVDTSPTLVTPVLGAATGTSIALTGAGANILAAGLNGTTNAALNVDASTATSATGLNIKSAAAAGGLAVSVISSGTNENLTVDAKGSGTIALGANSTGGILINGSNALLTLSSGGIGFPKFVLSNAGSGTTTFAHFGQAVNWTGTGVWKFGASSTNPTLTVDPSTTSAVTGLSIKSAAVGAGIALSTISSGTNENLTLDAKGSGTLTLNATATGVINLNRATTITGNLTLGTAGNKLIITTGSNASAGTGTLVGGTVTISTTAVTASSLIFVTDTATTLTNVGSLSANTIVAGTSFKVTSTNVLDTSTFNYFIIN